MESGNLENVMEAVKALSPNEMRRVRNLINRLLSEPAPSSPEDLLAQHLLEAGIISEIKPPITDLTPYRDRELIEFEGKPVSEIIIEERR